MQTLTADESATNSTNSVAATVRTVVVEFAFVAALITVYRIGRLVSTQPGSALRNARRVIDLERFTGVFTEIGVQRAVLKVPGLIQFLDRYYAYVHFPATGLFMIWVFVRHRDRYRVIRNWFAGVTLAALAVHVTFPLAPPRMTHGFIDTLHVYGPNIYSRDTTQSAANQFAAMPSLHFGWALMIALSIVALVPRRSRWARWWLLHPAITLLAIVSTGNHYWIDATAAGALVVATAMFMGRIRPGANPMRRVRATADVVAEPDEALVPVG